MNLSVYSDKFNKKKMDIKATKFENADFSLVELDGIHRLTPHCKKHGAMNKITDKIWRCISQYRIEEPREGETMGRLNERVCDACCEEITL